TARNPLAWQRSHNVGRYPSEPDFHDHRKPRRDSKTALSEKLGAAMRIAQWKSLAALGLTAALALAAFGQTPAPDTIADVLLELSLGNIVEAISRLKRIVQENPVPEAYFYLSGIYTEMGRYDAAFRYL